MGLESRLPARMLFTTVVLNTQSCTRSAVVSAAHSGG
jgi:hypothetical protein